MSQTTSVGVTTGLDSTISLLTRSFSRRVFYSTSYTSGIPEMMRDFHIVSETLATLGVTTYLSGLAVGSVVSAPLSEVFGRRPIYICSMFVFMLLVLPCALATSLVEILVWRFLGHVRPLQATEILTDSIAADFLVLS